MAATIQYREVTQSGLPTNDAQKNVRKIYVEGNSKVHIFNSVHAEGQYDYSRWFQGTVDSKTRNLLLTSGLLAVAFVDIPDAHKKSLLPPPGYVGAVGVLLAYNSYNAQGVIGTTYYESLDGQQWLRVDEGSSFHVSVTLNSMDQPTAGIPDDLHRVMRLRQTVGNMSGNTIYTGSNKLHIPAALMRWDKVNNTGVVFTGSLSPDQAKIFTAGIGGKICLIPLSGRGNKWLPNIPNTMQAENSLVLVRRYEHTVEIFTYKAGDWISLGNTGNMYADTDGHSSTNPFTLPKVNGTCANQITIIEVAPITHKSPYEFNKAIAPYNSTTPLDFGRFRLRVSGTALDILLPNVLWSSDNNDVSMNKIHVVWPHAPKWADITKLCIITPNINDQTVLSIVNSLPPGTVLVRPYVIGINPQVSLYVMTTSGLKMTYNGVVSAVAIPKLASTGNNWNSKHVTCPVEEDVPLSEHKSPYLFSLIEQNGTLPSTLATGKAYVKYTGSEASLYLDAKLFTNIQIDKTSALIKINGADRLTALHAANEICVLANNKTLAQARLAIQAAPVGTVMVYVVDKDTARVLIRKSKTDILDDTKSITITSAQTEQSVNWASLSTSCPLEQILPPITHKSPYIFDKTTGFMVGTDNVIPANNFKIVGGTGSTITRLQLDAKLFNLISDSDDIVEVSITSAGQRPSYLAADKMCVFTREMTLDAATSKVNDGPVGTVALHIASATTAISIVKESDTSTTKKSVTINVDPALKSVPSISWNTLHASCPIKVDAGPDIFDSPRELILVHKVVLPTGVDKANHVIIGRGADNTLLLSRAWFTKDDNDQAVVSLSLPTNVTKHAQISNVITALSHIIVDSSVNDGSKINLPDITTGSMLAAICRIDDTRYKLWVGINDGSGEQWISSFTSTVSIVSGESPTKPSTRAYANPKTYPIMLEGKSKVPVVQSGPNSELPGNSIFHIRKSATLSQFVIPRGMISGVPTNRGVATFVVNGLSESVSTILRTVEDICLDMTSTDGQPSNLPPAGDGSVAIVRKNQWSLSMYTGSGTNWVLAEATILIYDTTIFSRAPIDYPLSGCVAGEAPGCTKEFEAIAIVPINSGMPGQNNSMDPTRTIVDTEAMRLYIPIIGEPNPCSPSTWAVVDAKQAWGDDRWTKILAAVGGQGGTNDPELFITNKNKVNSLPKADGNVAIVHDKISSTVSSFPVKLHLGTDYADSTNSTDAIAYSGSQVPCWLKLSIKLLAKEPSLGFNIEANTLYIFEDDTRSLVYIPHLEGPNACGTRRMSWIDFKAAYGAGVLDTLKSAKSVIVTAGDPSVIQHLVPASAAGDYVIFRHDKLTESAPYQVDFLSAPYYSVSHGKSTATPWEVTTPDCCRGVKTQSQALSQIPFSDTNAMVFKLKPNSKLGYITIYCTNTKPTVPSRVSLYMTKDAVPSEASIFVEDHVLADGIPFVIEDKRILKGMRVFAKTSSSDISVRVSSVEEIE